MLARYTIYRRRPKDAGPLPEGIRQDTRWRTRHVLRPTQEIVEAFLNDPTDAAWEQFESAYRGLLKARLEEDRTGFEQLAQAAEDNDVHLGCSCPTKKNPNVRRCHTFLALGFMHEHFPELQVAYP